MMFAGFPFGREPYDSGAGKLVLGLALDELRRRDDLRDHLGMNPEEREKIRTEPLVAEALRLDSQSAGVWGVLSLSETEGFWKEDLHLTLEVKSQRVEAMMTIPNAANDLLREKLKQLKDSGFRELTKEIVDNLEPLLRAHKGARPWCKGCQRRLPRFARPHHLDAMIEFNLLTAFDLQSAPDQDVLPVSGRPKMQPQWLAAAYDCLVNKKKDTNYYMQMGVVFPYDHCPELQQADAIDLIAKAWLACKPLVNSAR